MNFLKNKSLKTKILGLTLGITLLLGISASVLVNRLAATSKNSILLTYLTFSNSLQSAIAAQFFERYGDVQAFAANPGLRSTNQREIVDYLNDYCAMYGIYDLIMIVDTRGRLIAVNDKSPSGKAIPVEGLYKRDFSSVPWVKAALAGQFTEDKERNFSGTLAEDPQVDPIVSEVYGEKRYGSGFTAQLKDSAGNVIGIISNRAGARWFEHEFKSLYGAMNDAGLTNAELTMIDKQGTVLVDYDPYSNGGRVEVVHNFDVLGKLNLANVGLKAAQAVLQGKVGKEITMHARKKIEMATGYSPIIDQKFIPSLGWGVIVRSDAVSAFAAVNWMERFFYLLFGAIAIFAGLASVLFSNSLSKGLQALADSLGAEAEGVFSSSKQVAQASNSLSSSTTEQAAALQETVASIDEVSAMVQQNAGNAEKSRSASVESQKASDNGKLAIEEMIHSIEDIDRSNTDIMQQIEASNREIAEIVQVINEIGTKTKVINDIVFQTKLLSFNASVEAARAGEHGKGFAVVAEEVGNLAQMSGNAAKEISTLLESSIQKVERIVNETKQKVEQLIVSGKGKIETGTENAKRCSQVLEEIVHNVGVVNSMVMEIAGASKEQAQGVAEITKAMNQMDQVTQQNATAAQQCSGASDDLRSQAENMQGIVRLLSQTVLGGSGTGTASTPPDQGRGKTLAKVMPLRSVSASSARTADRLPDALDKIPKVDDPRFKSA